MASIYGMFGIPKSGAAPPPAAPAPAPKAPAPAAPAGGVAPRSLASTIGAQPSMTATPMQPVGGIGASLGLTGARGRGAKGKGFAAVATRRAAGGVKKVAAAPKGPYGPAMPMLPGGSPLPAFAAQQQANATQRAAMKKKGGMFARLAEDITNLPGATPGRYGGGFGGQAGRGAFQPGAPIGGQAPQSLSTPVPIGGPTAAVTKDPRIGTDWWGK